MSNKAKGKEENLVQTENKVLEKKTERVELLSGLANVAKDQKFKHANLSKKDYYNVANPKFANLVQNPLITEKTMALSDQGYFTFKAHKNATKKQLVHAIEKIFGIAVVDRIKTITSGQMEARWSHKKKKNVKVDIAKKVLVKFNPDVEINMEKIQAVMQNRENFMR